LTEKTPKIKDETYHSNSFIVEEKYESRVSSKRVASSEKYLRL